MSSTRESQILDAIRLLDTWPDNGRPDRIVGLEKTVALTESIGWIEQATVMKPCGCCGTLHAHYSYFRITSAGRAALELHRIHKAARSAKVDTNLETAFLAVMNAGDRDLALQAADFAGRNLLRRRLKVAIDAITARADA